MQKNHLLHGVFACRFLMVALCMLLFTGSLHAAGDEDYQRKRFPYRLQTKPSSKFWTIQH